MQSLLPRFWLPISIGATALSKLKESKTENSLLGSAARGDEDAFRRLKDCYSPFLRRFVNKRVGPSEAEDILQDTWIAIWTSLNSYRTGSSFRAWASAICMRRIQDHWRRQSCRPKNADWAEELETNGYVQSDFQSIELQQSMKVIWSALTTSQKELLTLYYSDELTLKEISLALNQNLNTTKYQFYRAHEVALGALNSNGVSGVELFEVFK